MEGRPRISFHRSGINDIRFWLIIFLSAGIRFYYSFHFLLTDETYNLITIETLAYKNDLHSYFFKHPPLYILLSAFFYYLIGPYPQVPSYISILFSVVSLIPFYLIAEGLTGKKAALWAAFFLAIMPANVYYSTWIKQDSMLLFFFLWGVYFYLNRRFWLAGLVIGIALLVKEFAFFFFPISLLISAINRKEEKWFVILREWLIPVVVAAVISFWWYVLFGQMFYLIAGEALTGAYIIEIYWHYPWWFFLRNLPYDLSYPIFALFLSGVALIVKEIYKIGLKKSDYSIPLAWLATIYIPISYLYMKTPWFMYLATPPLAIVASFGIVGLMQMFQSRVHKLAIAILISACLIFLLPGYDPLEYNLKLTGSKARQVPVEILTWLQGTSWKEMAMKKDFWEKKIKTMEGKVGFLEYPPLLQYFMGIRDERVAKVRVSKFMAFDKAGLLNYAREEGIGVFILFSESLTYTKKNLDDMVSIWGEPEKIGPLLVFSVK